MGPCVHCMRGKQTHNHQNPITITEYYPTKDKEALFSRTYFI